MTYHEALFNHTANYLKLNIMKELQREQDDFVSWVLRNYVIDKSTVRIARVAVPAHEKAATTRTRPCVGGCHEVHFKGSSARYLKETSQLLGQVTTEEFVAFAEKQAEQEGDMGPRAMTAENFDENTKGTKSAFVMFSMAGCVHCANMEEAWRQLATTVHTNHPGTVRIGTVDCDDQREFCEMFQIQGFPTLLLMKDPEVSASRGNQHPLLHVPRNFDQACTDPAVARFVTSRLCLLVVGPGVCRCTRTPHQSSSRVSAAMRACSSSSRTRASWPLRHNPCQRRLQGRGEG